MTALDGLLFRLFIKSNDLQKSLRALNLSDEHPKSVTTIQKIVNSYNETIPRLLVQKTPEHKLNGKDVRITFNEFLKELSIH